MRNIDLEITKKIQQKNNLDDDLENILSDADLDQYKKLGNLIKTYENEISQLKMSKQRLSQDIDDFNNQVNFDNFRFFNYFRNILVCFDNFIKIKYLGCFLNGQSQK